MHYRVAPREGHAGAQSAVFATWQGGRGTGDWVGWKMEPLLSVPVSSGFPRAAFETVSAMWSVVTKVTRRSQTLDTRYPPTAPGVRTTAAAATTTTITTTATQSPVPGVALRADEVDPVAVLRSVVCRGPCRQRCASAGRRQGQHKAESWAAVPSGSSEQSSCGTPPRGNR